MLDKFINIEANTDVMSDIKKAFLDIASQSNNSTQKSLFKKLKNGEELNVYEQKLYDKMNEGGILDQIVESKVSKLENKLYVSEKQMSSQEKARLSSEILSNLNRNDTLNDIKFGTKLNGNHIILFEKYDNITNIKGAVNFERLYDNGFSKTEVNKIIELCEKGELRNGREFENIIRRIIKQNGLNNKRSISAPSVEDTLPKQQSEKTSN